MKITRKHLYVAILLLGFLLIAYGLVKLLFKVDFGPMIEENFPNVVFYGAAALFLWNRSLWSKEKKERDEAAQAQAAQAAQDQIPPPEEKS